ncbi:beta-ketoacyl-ACP synthase [Methylococcus sp. EFPC2]|uniref:beta-ketoacyl-ACP synthase n=1 Tax=Methylococcus sp. EFPC2 TaxID=2812648 RepID=UPI0019678B2A|nr:beta-ketoacyl-ACP synthase [Methylococcus sp. EFPC2]QSA98868.1 beta-ketoacyl-ACP synthase [Methylococcus sp. EFPC2]
MPNSPRIAPVAVAAYQCVSAAGDDVDALYRALADNVCRLGPIELFPLPFETMVGEVRTELPAIRPQLSRYDCRNARLALKALNQDGFRAQVEDAANRYGTERVGVVLGTSTSGIYDSEVAYVRLLREGHMPEDFHFMTRHAPQATAEFLRDELGLSGPCYAISTACSSSAKALAAGQRLIASGFCDAVLVAGVDTLCRLTLRGFNSLELISPTPAAPMDRRRRGINIGEAAGLLLLEKTHSGNADKPRLLAVGESSDAHHMSAPHPEGAGAVLAMRRALELAGLEAADVGYVNLHATATPQNDLAEAKAIAQVFPQGVPFSGIKGLLGHTLGAAGAVEAVVSLLALERELIPGTCGLQEPDPNCAIDVLAQPRLGAKLRHVLSNSFGFGGNNAAVLLQAGGRA